jgi:hypothetical protein
LRKGIRAGDGLSVRVAVAHESSHEPITTKNLEIEKRE